MTNPLNLPGAKGCAANIAAFVGSAVVMNGVIFGLGWNASSGAGAPFIPPGPVVGAVWVALFALMGTASWRYLRRVGRPARAVEALATFCLAFPLYTAGLSNQTIGIIGTIVTLAAAIATSLLVARRSRPAALLIAPTIAWTAYVSVIGTLTGRI